MVKAEGKVAEVEAVARVSAKRALEQQRRVSQVEFRTVCALMLAVDTMHKPCTNDAQHIKS